MYTPHTYTRTHLYGTRLRTRSRGPVPHARRTIGCFQDLCGSLQYQHYHMTRSTCRTNHRAPVQWSNRTCTVRLSSIHVPVNRRYNVTSHALPKQLFLATWIRNQVPPSLEFGKKLPWDRFERDLKLRAKIFLFTQLPRFRCILLVIKYAFWGKTQSHNHNLARPSPDDRQWRIRSK